MFAAARFQTILKCSILKNTNVVDSFLLLFLIFVIHNSPKTILIGTRLLKGPGGLT